METGNANYINQDDLHLLNSLEKLEEAGFTDQIIFRDGALHNLTNNKSYGVNQVRRHQDFRFEGMTNPDDESILFAIEFNDDRKGTLAAVYGPQADIELFEFMKKTGH